jgi:hypothetical protein
VPETITGNLFWRAGEEFRGQCPSGRHRIRLTDTARFTVHKSAEAMCFSEMLAEIPKTPYVKIDRKAIRGRFRTGPRSHVH